MCAPFCRRFPDRILDHGGVGPVNSPAIQVYVDVLLARKRENLADVDVGEHAAETARDREPRQEGDTATTHLVGPRHRQTHHGRSVSVAELLGPRVGEFSIVGIVHGRVMSDADVVLPQVLVVHVARVIEHPYQHTQALRKHPSLWRIDIRVQHTTKLPRVVEMPLKTEELVEGAHLPAHGRSSEVGLSPEGAPIGCQQFRDKHFILLLVERRDPKHIAQARSPIDHREPVIRP